MRKLEICLYIDVQADVRWIGKERGVGREDGEGGGWVGKEERGEGGVEKEERG